MILTVKDLMTIAETVGRLGTWSAPVRRKDGTEGRHIVLHARREDAERIVRAHAAREDATILGPLTEGTHAPPETSTP